MKIQRKCPFCNRQITVTREGNGQFRRHMIRKGEICEGSWRFPKLANAQLKEAQDKAQGIARIVSQRLTHCHVEMQTEDDNPLGFVLRLSVDNHPDDGRSYAISHILSPRLLAWSALSAEEIAEFTLRDIEEKSEAYFSQECEP